MSTTAFFRCVDKTCSERLVSSTVSFLALSYSIPQGMLLAVFGKGARHRCIAASAEKEQDEPAVNYNKEFGYSRKDVVLIGVGLVALGYALYYGIQAAGVDALMAGNITQLIIIVGLCIVWVGSYVFRVMNKVCAPGTPQVRGEHKAAAAAEKYQACPVL